MTNEDIAANKEGSPEPTLADKLIFMLQLKHKAIVLKGALSDLNQRFLNEDSEEADLISACNGEADELVAMVKVAEKQMKEEFNIDIE